jgi:hypothetical protein
MTSTYPTETPDTATSLIAATLFQKCSDRKHKLWNNKSDKKYTLYR